MTLLADEILETLIRTNDELERFELENNSSHNQLCNFYNFYQPLKRTHHTSY